MARVRCLCACFGLLVALLGTEPAHAVTSSAMIDRAPLGQYRSIKQVIAELYPTTGKTRRLMASAGPYDVSACGRTGADYIDGDKGRLMADTASDVVAWTDDLTSLGYPSSVWKGLLDAYESAALAAMRDSTTSDWRHDGPLATSLTETNRSFKRRLTDALNVYRLSGHRSLAPVVDDDGDCERGKPGLGAAIKVTPRALLGPPASHPGNLGVDVTIRTDPQGGQVMLITIFNYKLCKAQGIDPDDRSTCDHWTEALDNAPTTIAGRYYYSAQWSGGSLRRGTLDDTNKREGTVIVLHKP